MKKKKYDFNNKKIDIINTIQELLNKRLYAVKHLLHNITQFFFNLKKN